MANYTSWWVDFPGMEITGTDEYPDLTSFAKRTLKAFKKGLDARLEMSGKVPLRDLRITVGITQKDLDDYLSFIELRPDYDTPCRKLGTLIDEGMIDFILAQ